MQSSQTGTIHEPFGGIAQLVERLTGSQEVRGSNPLTSTEEFLAAFAGSSVTMGRDHLLQYERVLDTPHRDAGCRMVPTQALLLVARPRMRVEDRADASSEDDLGLPPSQIEEVRE